MSIPLISKIKPQNNGTFPMYDDVDGYGGFQVRANTTDRNSIPTLNRKQGMLVYTLAEENFWQLNADLTTWTAVLQSSVIPNSFWSQSIWYVDPVSGNNANDGMTSGTAIKTWSEIIKRWGTYSPVIVSPINITFLSDMPDFSDPIIANPAIIGDGYISLTGTLTNVGSGMLASVVAKNYNATGNYPNGLLQADLGGAATGHQGYLLSNITKGANCWIDSLSGTVATLTQPMVPNSYPFNDTPNEIDTFANTDAFIVYKPTKIYISNLKVDIYSSSATSAFNIQHLWLQDPIAIGSTITGLSHTIRITEARIDTKLSYYQDNDFLNNQLINCWIPGAMTVIGCWIIGGAVGTIGGKFSLSGLLDGGVIFHGEGSGGIFLSGGIYIENNQVGSVYFSTGSNPISISGDTIFSTPQFGYSGTGIWGQYKIDLHRTSYRISYLSPATSTFKGTSVFSIDGVSFANSYDRTTDPGIWHPARALTVANLDLPISLGGFNGLAIGDGGSIITDGYQTTSISTNYNFFVDPSNVSGLASDGYDGLSNTTPILTTKELNRRLKFVSLVANTTITYMSDVLTSDDSLDFSTLNQKTFNLTFQGTPQILHTGGTIATGTIAMNPMVSNGGQRQVVHTSDISDFTSYIYSGLGGGAIYPCLLMDTVSGNSSWIVSAYQGNDGYASMSAPCDGNGNITTLTIGDNYQIQRGSLLSLAGTNPISFSAFPPSGFTPLTTFNDFTFNLENVGQNSVDYFRCAFTNSITTSSGATHCFINGLSQLNEISASFVSGVFHTTTNDYSGGLLSLGGDVYITGQTLSLGNIYLGSVYISDIFGGHGAQINDMTSFGITVYQSAEIGFSGSSSSLVWGNGNDGYGIGITPGSSVIVRTIDTPTLTGTLGDFCFLPVGDGYSVIGVARAFDESMGAYTEAGHVATRITSWANFKASIASGGLGYQAQSLSTGAGIFGPGGFIL